MPEFQNPNIQSQGPGGGGGGGDLRSMLAVGFMAVAIFLGYQYFQKPKQNAPVAPAQSQQQSGGDSSIQPTSLAGSPNPTQPGATAQPAIAAAAETETTVENSNYRIVFTNRGAQVKHWILKHYFQSDGKTPLDMVQTQAASMVQTKEASHYGLPLSVFTYDDALASQVNQSLYQASATGTVQAPTAITFHSMQNGVDVLKTFRFESDYVITAELQVRRNGQPVRALLAWPAGLGDMEEFQGRSAIPGLSRTPSSLAWSVDGSQGTAAPNGGGFLFWTQPGVSNGATSDIPYQYYAVTDLYFAAAFLPDVPQRTSVVTLHHAIDLPTDLSNPNSEKRPADVLGLAVGDTSGFTRVRLYAGPKQMDLLAGIHSTGADGKQDGPTLQSLIQFGSWLGIIAKPLFLALRFLNEHGIPSWGWDIIILTVLFNMLMLPTRIMMMRSSLKMMRIQPKVEAIKRKYANLKATDPKKAEMNAEMMTLYKTEGVNMYGGCLPLIIQMPLFFAYFRVLQNTVELRQAHWYWLTDLSTPDPLHILPIIIIVTMFLTQFITPSPGMDPAQRRMMAIMMPIIFGFTLWHYASGLAVYWCTGNLINLGIQVAINQSHIGKEMHAIAAKRAAKKTIQGKR